MSRYVSTGSTAAGGIGSIIYCHDNNLDRKVAVKFIQPGAEHRRLLDELAALQRIRSKHVVEIFDVAYFDPGARMGIVEEYIAGNDVQAWLGKLKPDLQFVRLLFQMSAGLTDIHAVGIVHRDIKPANMLIDGEGILKIIDFNLARSADDAHTHGFVGTRGYAAPELYSLDQVNFDEKIDVYALAVVAHALLSGPKLSKELLGRPPLPGIWKAATGGFTALYPSLDRELARLLDASLSENSAARPSASELQERAGRELLSGKHRALLSTEAGATYQLHAAQPSVTLKHPGGVGEITIAYDNLAFYVKSVIGEVWVNNMQLDVDEIVPDCCVIALGAPSRNAADRMFITMDVSHPEVVL